MPDENNSLSNPDLAPDIIHSKMQSVFADENMGYHDKDNFVDLALENPNTPTHTLSMIVDNHVIKPEDGFDDIADRHQLRQILKHPNVNAQVAENILSKNYDKDSYHAEKELRTAAKVPGVSQDLLYGLVNKYLTHQLSYNPINNLNGENLLKLHDAHDEIFADTENTDYERYQRVLHDNLAQSTNHTPESLDRAIDYFLSPRREGDFDRWTVAQSFVEKNKDLNTDQLNKIYENRDQIVSNSTTAKNRLVRAIVDHGNVSPVLLADLVSKINHDNENYRDGWNHKVKARALKNPNLPDESFDAVFQKLMEREDGYYGSTYNYPAQIAHTFIQNPKITPEHLKALYHKGLDQAFYHEKMDQDTLREWWNNSDKKAEAADKILSTQNVPADVLKDIVAHNRNIGKAIAALNHHNADDSVLAAGLTRRAAAMQEAVINHPNVSPDLVADRIKQGKLNFFSAISVGDITNKLRQLPEDKKDDLFNYIFEKTKGTNYTEIGEASKLGGMGDVIRFKRRFMTSPIVPESIRQQQKKEFVDYLTSLGPETDVYNSEEQSAVYNAVQYLALDPDHRIPEAQDAMAQSNYFVRRSNLRDLPFPGEKLNFIAQRLMDENDLLTVGPNDPESDEKKVMQKARQLQSLIGNKRLPSATLSQIFSAPAYFNDISSLLKHSYYSNSKVGTVLDDSIIEKTDQEKKEFFESILPVNLPNSAAIVVASKQAPLELREQAMDQLLSHQDSGTVLNTISQIGASNLPARDQARVLSWSLYDNFTDVDEASLVDVYYKQREQIFKKLQNQPQQDAFNIMKQYADSMAHLPSEAINNSQIIDTGWAPYIPHEIFEGQRGSDLLATMHDSAAFSKIYPELALKAVYMNHQEGAKKGVNRMLFYNNDPSKPHVSDEAQEDFLSIMDNWRPNVGFDYSTSEGRKEANLYKWTVALRYPQVLDFLKKGERDADGNITSARFDVVVDSFDKSSANYNEVLQNFIKHKLITPVYQAQLANDPANIPSLMRYANQKTRRELMWSFFDKNPEPSYNQIKSLRDYFYSGYFGTAFDSTGRHISNYTPDDEEKTVIRDRMEKVFKAVRHAVFQEVLEATASRDRTPPNISNELNNIFTKAVFSSDAVNYSRDYIREATMNWMDLGEKWLDDNQKDNFMINFRHNAVNNWGIDVAGDVAKDRLINKALSNDNVDLMIKLFREGISSARLNEKMQEHLSNPELISSEDLLSFANLIPEDRLDIDQSKAVLDAMNNRVGIKAERNDPDFPDYFNNFIQKSYQLATHSYLNNEIKRVAANHVLKIGADGYFTNWDETTEPRVNQYVLNTLRFGSEFDDELARKAFIELPTGEVGEGVDESRWLGDPPMADQGYGFNRNFFNDESIIRDAYHGWKLAAILGNVNGGKELKPELVDTLINRLIDNPLEELGIDMSLKNRFIRRSTEQGKLTGDMFTKLLRGQSYEEIDNLLNGMRDVRHAQKIPNTHIAAEEIFKRVKQRASESNMPVDMWLGRAYKTIYHAGAFIKGDDITQEKEKKRTLNNIIQGTLELIDEHYDGKIHPLLHTDIDSLDAEAKGNHYAISTKVLQQLRSIGVAITNGLPDRHKYETPEQAHNILNFINKQGEIRESSAKQLKFYLTEDGYTENYYNDGVAGQSYYSKEAPTLMQGWIQRTPEMATEDWKQSFTTFPEAVYSVPLRSSVEAGILDAMDFDAIHSSIDSDARLSSFYNMIDTMVPKLTQDAKDKHLKNLINHTIKANKIAEMNEFESKRYRRRSSPFYLESDAVLANLALSSPNTVDHFLCKKIEDAMLKDRDAFKMVAVERGLGGVDYVKPVLMDHVDKITSTLKNESEIARMESYDAFDQELDKEGALVNQFGRMLRSPVWDEDMTNKVVKLLDSHGIYFLTNAKVYKATYSPKVPEDVRWMIADLAFDPDGKYKNSESPYIKEHVERMSYDIKDWQQSLLKKGYIPKEYVQKSFDEQWSAIGEPVLVNEKVFPNELLNPEHGPELQRSIPIYIHPEMTNVDKEKLITSVAEETKQTLQLNQLLKLIPPEGIAWPEFKKANKKMANFPAVQKVFQTAGKGNKPILPEHVLQSIEEYDKNAKRFDITYTYWDNRYGWVQKYNPEGCTHELVVQTNYSEMLEKELKKDPRLWELARQQLMKANGISENRIGIHPTTPLTISWSRVDTSNGEKGWIIEEFQSDFERDFRKKIMYKIAEEGTELNINGKPVTKEEIENMSKAIAKANSGYLMANLKAVIENAKRHGVKKLYMHGIGLRAGISGYQKDSEDYPIPPGWYYLYMEMPEKFGFKPIKYTDYPVTTDLGHEKIARSRETDTCWVLDLTDGETEKKK